MSARLRSGLLAGALLAGALGCGEAGPTAEIRAHRTASRPSSRVIPGATASQRFAEQRQPPSDASDDLLSFDYDLPEGWMAIAPAGDRQINLRPAGDPEAECYLSIFPGGGGGLEANINRWRGQLGAAPLSGAEIAALPTALLFGREATLVEVEGTFKSMGGGTPRAGFKLLGLAISEPEFGIFLKLTGPAGLVDLERARFLAFAGSLRLATKEGDPHAGHSEGDGHDHGEGATAAAEETPTTLPAADVTSAGTLSWKTPPGWSVQPTRPMREVTFTLPEGGECYVTRLTGDAGGLRANLDRWRSQVGRAPLSEQDFAALERVEMLGQRVPVLALEGTFTGMDGVERADQGLLGVACIRGEDSLFVKLTGPESVVRAQHGSFLAFVRSLEETP